MRREICQGSEALTQTPSALAQSPVLPRVTVGTARMKASMAFPKIENKRKVKEYIRVHETLNMIQIPLKCHVLTFSVCDSLSVLCYALLFSWCLRISHKHLPSTHRVSPRLELHENMEQVPPGRWSSLGEAHGTSWDTRETLLCPPRSQANGNQTDLDKAWLSELTIRGRWCSACQIKIFNLHKLRRVFKCNGVALQAVASAV